MLTALFIPMINRSKKKSVDHTSGSGNVDNDGFTINAIQGPWIKIK